MKKRILQLSSVLFMLFVLFVVACRKDQVTYSDDSADNATTSLSVKDARRYFYNSLRKSQSASVLAVTSSPDGKNRKVYPYWNHAYASKTAKFDFVELPVASVHQQRNLRTAGPAMTDAESKSVLAASFTRLVLYRDKKGIMNQRLITFIPDYDYLKKHNNDVSYNHIDKLDKDYSGYLEYRDWNNSLLFTLKLSNGKVVAHFKPAQKLTGPQVQSLKTTDLKNKTNTESCVTYQVTVWEQDCMDFTDPDNPDAGLVTICSDWYIADQYYETDCNDIDCTDPANFSDAACGGGGSDPGGCQVNSYVKNGIMMFDVGNCNPDIIDSIKFQFPCFQSQILDVLSSIRGYNDIVAPFETNVKPNLTWDNGSLDWYPNGGHSTTLGTTHVDPTSYTGMSSIITLNTDMLQNASELMIAATSIHETLHAYINYDLVMNNPTFTPNGNWFDGLETFINANGLPSNYRDHYEMLTDYFNKAVDILASFDNHQHTIQEYAEAMLFGLDTANPNASAAQQDELNQEYINIQLQYSITPSMLNTFWNAQLNASTTNKLPGGCQ